MTAAMKKATEESSSLKKQLWVKDREMASIINKFNAADTENKRMKQIINKTGNKSSKESSVDSTSGSYTFREVQELRAQLDACRVELKKQRKKNIRTFKKT